MYKSVILALPAIAGLAYAQVPACAAEGGCITLPDCNNDPSCICNDRAWIANVSCCVFQKCDTADQQQALAFAQSICTPVNATLPSEASCEGVNTTNATTTTSSTASASSAAASSSGLANAMVAPAVGGMLAMIAGAAALL